jgi:3-hydroxyisobutyrate dehydrogenase
MSRAKPWLDAIGKATAHLGPVGRGQEGKLLNNLISVANYGMSAAIIDVAKALSFEETQITDALMAGSAQSFALRVAPGFLRPRDGRGSAASFMDLHDLLKKDVDHCRNLPPSDPAAMEALLASCEAMLARLRRAAEEAEG